MTENDHSPSRAPFPSILSFSGWCLAPGILLAAADGGRQALGGGTFLRLHGSDLEWLVAMLVTISFLGSVIWLAGVATFVLWNSSRGLAFRLMDRVQVLGMLVLILCVFAWSGSH